MNAREPTDTPRVLAASDKGLLAESHLTRRPFGSILRRVAMVPSPAG